MGLMVAAIDFDHTIWDSPNNQPMSGAREAINYLREKGVKIVIHSCNNKSWIEKCLNNADIRFDWIWDQTGKPVADIYIDDCGYHFTDWITDAHRILKRIQEGNPMVIKTPDPKSKDSFSEAEWNALEGFMNSGERR